jgi:hypothetical protein
MSTKYTTQSYGSKLGTSLKGVVGGSFIISFVVIAIAWIFFRPTIGISLLLIAGAAFYFGKKHFSKEPVAETKPIITEDGTQQ